MTIRRPGWNDELTDARLAWLTGTAFPEAPQGLYVALYTSAPFGDGSNAAEMERIRVGPVSFCSPRAGHSFWPTARWIEPLDEVEISLPGPAEPLVPVDIAAWGLLSEASGGTPLYVGVWPATLHLGHTIKVKPQVFRVFAELSGQPH